LERWLAALVGVTLTVFGGGVALAAEQIAAEAPVPTDPRAFGGYYVMSPYSITALGPAGERQIHGQTTLSDVVPTVSGRLSHVDVFFANYAGLGGGIPVVENLFVDLTRVDAEGRATDVLATAGVPVSSLPQPSSGVLTTPTAVPFSNGPQIVAGERYALVYRADGCCVGEQDAQETPSVPDAWIGQIPYGSATTTWGTRYSTYPAYYQGTVAVRMWVDPSVPIPPGTPPVATPPSPPAPAVPQRASDVAPLCGRPVVLTDVTLRGRDVRLAGVARAQYGGRPVAIIAEGRVVALATVALDGTFRATAKRTKSSATLRYQARVGVERSAALRANRRLIIDSQTAVGGGVRVRGHLVGRRRAHRVLAVARQLGCSPTSTPNAKTLRTDGRGRFSVTLPTPPAGQLIAVYRLRTTSGGKTYTVPVVLRAR
jgi:hypothetical protein